MKKLIISMAFTLVGVAIMAQDIAQKEVPSIVLNSFQQHFTKADDVEWERENGQYVVEFELDNAEQKAWLDDRGKLLMHGPAISKQKLPEAVKAAIKRDYAGFDLDDAYQLNGHGTISYIAELEKGKEEVTVVYHADGTKKQ